MAAGGDGGGEVERDVTSDRLQSPVSITGSYKNFQTICSALYESDENRLSSVLSTFKNLGNAKSIGSIWFECGSGALVSTKQVLYSSICLKVATISIWPIEYDVLKIRTFYIL